MDAKKMKELLKAMDLEKFRISQIIQAIFKQGISDFKKISTLPEDLRKKLSGKLEIYCLELLKESRSKDGTTTKALFQTKDGCRIESVLMRFRDGRNSVCVSSQAGCRLGCTFCATGKMGFKRNLSSEEISDQVLFFLHRLAGEKQKITNVIYMGMGEPLMNYDGVLESVRVLNDKTLFDLGARNITISTAGICEGIEKLAEENIQINLAVSLHAADQEKRQLIMPVAKMYSLEKLIASIKKYISRTNRRVSFEYIMLKGINDGDDDATKLAVLTEDLLCHVNLIPYNATDGSGMAASDRNRIKRFREILESHGIPVTVRVSLGQEIDAACGQLANK